jgi:2-oxoacid:acceptor oxidoreductase gamma subunit (pyruvate/2-ketoisovalerate family)
MREIRWHGRGGQGAVTSSKILADAGYRSGWVGVTAAPTFGAERRGAPITASTRLAREAVRVLSQVTNPDIVVVLDETLLQVGRAAAGVKPGATLIVNTTRTAVELREAELADAPADARIVTADVTGAARAVGLIVGGQPMVNTAILGSIAQATGIITLESVEAAIADVFAPGPAAKNIEAARIAAECTKG